MNRSLFTRPWSYWRANYLPILGWLFHVLLTVSELGIPLLYLVLNLLPSSDCEDVLTAAFSVSSWNIHTVKWFLTAYPGIYLWVPYLIYIKTWKRWSPYTHYIPVELVAWLFTTDRPSAPPKPFAGASRMLRNNFNKCLMTPIAPQKNHTHGQCAKDRNEAGLFAERYAASVGLVPYFCQMSSSDQAKGRQGSRKQYWVKDMQVKPRDFNPPANALLVFIDVDYYVDMPWFVNENRFPMLIYAFQPKSVAYTSPEQEYAYRFLPDNFVEFNVSGGGRYTHKLWNYSTDHFIAKLNIFGPLLTKVLTYALGHEPVTAQAAYYVDRKGTQAEHEMILLTPMAYWNNLFKFQVSSIEGQVLHRYEVVDGEFTRLRVMSKAGLTVSTGRVGEFNSATVPAEVDEALASMARTTKTGLTLAHVKEYLDTVQKVHAPVLFEYHRRDNPRVHDTTFPVEDAIRRYQFSSSKKGFDFDAKPSMTAFMSPFLPDCYAPDKCQGNEEAGIQARIIDVASDAVPNEFLLGVMKEFVELLVPTPNKLHPYELEVVRERQSKPSQRVIFEKGTNGSKRNRVIEMFGKAEAKRDTATTRLISQFCAEDKIQYSRYIYVLVDELLHDQKWYGFSKTPKEVAERVVEMLATAGHACNTDMSKFDGHVSPLLRELEQMVLARAFHEEYLPELLDYHDHQYGIPAFGRHDTSYLAGTARGSGSPETSCFNSIANAFIAFLALRMTRETLD